MTALMRDAVKPNLLQTLEHGPVLVHAGPFGNIATGNSSVVADQVGIRMGDFLVTEAGFGADMGAERFFNVKCRVSGLVPDAAVLVATVRSLKAHSGRHDIRPGRPLPPELLEENPDEVMVGGANLRKQIENVRAFGVSPVVAINAFPTDHPSPSTRRSARSRPRPARGPPSARTSSTAAPGAEELAEMVAEAAEEPGDFRFLYPLEATLVEKIETVAHAGSTAPTASTSRRRQPASCAGTRSSATAGFPVVIAKTHLSLSSDPRLLGAPTGWRMPVREVRAAAGAGYVYAICGDMRTMPGLRQAPRRRAHRHRRGRQRHRPLLRSPGKGRQAGGELGRRAQLGIGVAALRRPTEHAVRGPRRRRAGATRPCARSQTYRTVTGPSSPRPSWTVTGQPRAHSPVATPGVVVITVTPSMPGVSRSPTTRPSSTPSPTPAA